MSPQIVDVWIRDLDATEPTHLSDSTLSSTERTRARALRAGRVRDRWVVGRATLRAILGRELGLDPTEVELDSGPHGKPLLPSSPLHFNVSHSGPLLAVATTRTGPVGLDVELVLKMNDIQSVVRRICDAEEEAFLAAVDDEADHLRAFYRVWTAKEAVLKSAGVGFEVDPSAVRVDVTDSPPRLSNRLPSELKSCSWGLARFEVPPEGSWAPTEAVGTIALSSPEPVPGPVVPRIRRWQDGADR